MLNWLITALVTPMLENGEVDYNSLTRLVEWQIASGVNGLGMVASTGESGSLTNKEKIEIINHVVKINAKRVKLIAGIGSISTAATLEFLSQVNQIEGIDYVMCITPYYVRPTQSGLYEHFSQVALSSKYPVILYNVPARTGCDLKDDTILRLMRECPNIVGIKDATGNISRCTYLKAQKTPEFMLLSGDDASSLAFLLAGGDGVISVVSNIRPQLHAQMCNAALSGNYDEAFKLNLQLNNLYNLMGCESNPIPAKWVLWYEKRIDSAALRLPLMELCPTYHEIMKQELERVK